MDGVVFWSDEVDMVHVVPLYNLAIFSTATGDLLHAVDGDGGVCCRHEAHAQMTPQPHHDPHNADHAQHTARSSDNNNQDALNNITIKIHQYRQTTHTLSRSQ